MKKVLFIAPYDIRKNFGGGLATKAYLKSILKIFNNNVDIIVPSEIVNDLNFNQNVKIIGIKKRSKLVSFFNLIFGVLSRYRYPVNLYLKKYYQKYDLCVLNNGVYAGELITALNNFSIRSVVIHHNFEMEYHMSNKTLLSFKGLMPYYVIRNERKAFNNAYLNLFLTSNDLDKLFKSYGRPKGKSFVLGCYEPEIRELPKVSINNNYNNTIIISGSLSTFQTINGIEDLIMNYIEVIKSIIPDFKIIITGRSPKSKLYDLVNDYSNQICVIPNPENIESIIARGSIFINPTCIGSGLKLRNMDGLRMGKPILSHRISARGYESFLTKPYFKIYWDKDSFRNSFNELYSYINSSSYNPITIQNDYYKVFSFEAGIKRLEDTII